MANADPSDDPAEFASDGRGVRTTLALLVLFCLIVFMLLVPIPIEGRTAIAVGDLAHAPLFGSIALGTLLLIRLRLVDPVPIGTVLFVAVTTFLFGVTIEVVQSMSGRMATVHDAVANGMGILAAIAAYYSVTLRHRSHGGAIAGALIAVGILAIAWLPPLTVLYDVAKARQQFPVLATFESPGEFGRFYFHHCQPRLASASPTDGSYAMEVTFSAAVKYPAIRLQDFNPDWSSVQSLEIDLMLDQSFPNESFSLMVKVVDRNEDQAGHEDSHFWRTIELLPGKLQHVSVKRQELVEGSQSLQLDMHHVKGIDFIAIEPAQDVRIRFDTIQLVIEP